MKPCSIIFSENFPLKVGYTVFADLGDLLEILQELHFTNEDIKYLNTLGLKAPFTERLKNFRFHGTLYAAKEGEVVFPNEPILIRR